MGGEIEAFYPEEAAELELVEKPEKKIQVNVLIDPHIREVLLSDYASGMLGIIILDIRKGTCG